MDVMGGYGGRWEGGDLFSKGFVCMFYDVNVCYILVIVW